ncbi:class GN sortase [Erythrobacter sp. NAP1]|uniref:class GN sortase n=1 Tax=Erythrobacter sp. NAP1 TaxID=237727 RepID=UPI0002D2C85D|nr:class GN sortase [Erythrobacter sp. NAP1]
MRALPFLVVAALLVSGAALVAKALYIPVKAEVAQVLLERAFERGVASGAPVKPWSWADTAPVARVSVPRLGASEIVLSGGSGEAMAFGPTALLDDAARGITVLAAHRDTHFEFVADVEAGDLVRFERIDGGAVTYRITHLETVRWDEFAYPTHADNGILALTTCWPFGTHTPGPLRRVAWAEEVDLRV